MKAWKPLLKDNLTIFMMVNNIYSNKKIVIKSGQTIISEYRRTHLAPSEMEKVILERSMLQNVHDNLIISLEDGE